MIALDCLTNGKQNNYDAALTICSMFLVLFSAPVFFARDGARRLASSDEVKPFIAGLCDK